jgi:hypothetical protein
VVGTLAAEAAVASTVVLMAVARAPEDTLVALTAARVRPEACVANRPPVAVRPHRIRGRGKGIRRHVTPRPAGTDFRAQAEAQERKPRRVLARQADLGPVQRPDARKLLIMLLSPMETGIRSELLTANLPIRKLLPRITSWEPIHSVTLASITSVGAAARGAGAEVGAGAAGAGLAGIGAGVGGVAAGVGDGAVGAGVRSGLGLPTGTTRGSMATTRRRMCSIHIPDNLGIPVITHL